MKNHILFKFLIIIAAVSFLNVSIGYSGSKNGQRPKQDMEESNQSGQTQNEQQGQGTYGQPGQSGTSQQSGQYNQQRQRMETGIMSPEERVDKIHESVNLTENQRSRILKIYTDAEMEQQGGGEEMDEWAVNSEVEKVLTPEQTKKWQEASTKETVEDKIEKINEAVNLTDDQRRKITPIIEKEIEAKKEMMKEMRSQGGEDYDRPMMMEKMNTIRNETNKQIESILTKEQLKKYNAMPKTMMQQSGQSGYHGSQHGRSGQTGMGTQSGQSGQQGTTQSGQTGQMGRTGMMTPESRVDEINEAVELNDSQRAEILRIYQNAERETQGGGEEMDEWTVNSEVKKVLTSEQAKKWQDVSHKKGIDDRINEINEAVNLTDDQKRRLTPIIEKEMKAKKDLMGEMRSQGGEDYDRPTMTNKMSSIREETNRAIENILTEEQLKKYNAMPGTGMQRQY